MRFLPSEDQLAFAATVDEVVERLGATTIAQRWAEGDSTAGVVLWQHFAELGIGGLRIAEDDGGLGGSANDLVVIFERLGYHAAPGPYLESVALLPRLVDRATRGELAEGAIATASVAGLAPAALDAEAASLRFVIADGAIARASVGTPVGSLATTRRLALLEPLGDRVELDPAILAAALDETALAAAAFLIGAGERLLDEAVGYAKVREQFGRPIGEFQAIKHRLASVRVALSFARPLVWAAAVGADGPSFGRDVSAAKATAAKAATQAMHAALQVHGAIGYTGEHPLHIWLGLVPALANAWGTPAYHRARVAAALAAG